MKKEINSKIAKTMETQLRSESDLSTSTQTALNGGVMLPVGANFQLVDIIRVKANGNINSYDAMVVELQNGTQISLGLKSFCGVYYPANLETFSNSTELDKDNFFLKSNMNIFDFLKEHQETIFEVISPLVHNTFPYGKEIAKPKSLLRYRPIEEKKK